MQNDKDIPMNDMKLSMLALAVAMSLAACGGSSGSSPDTGEQPPVNENPSDPGDENDNGDDSDDDSDTGDADDEGSDDNEQDEGPYEHRLEGYVVYNDAVPNAYVCVDFSGDKSCESGAPSAYTDQDGKYTLTFETDDIHTDFFVLARIPASARDVGANAAANTDTNMSDVLARGFVSQSSYDVRYEVSGNIKEADALAGSASARTGVSKHTSTERLKHNQTLRSDSVIDESSAQNQTSSDEASYVKLHARGAYGGHVNTFTNLEAAVFEPGLEPMLNTERMALARYMITMMYSLPWDITFDQLAPASFSEEFIADLYANNKSVYDRFGIAQGYDIQGIHALHVTMESRDLADVPTQLQRLHYVPPQNEMMLSNQERETLIDSVFVPGEEVTFAIYDDHFVELLNERANEVVEVDQYFGNKELYVGTPYTYETNPMLCWRDDNWVAFEGQLDHVERLDDFTYRVEDSASGMGITVHARGIDRDSAVYESMTHAWADTLALSEAPLPQTLVNYVLEDDVQTCIPANFSGGVANNTLFSDMTGSELVRVVSSSAFNSGNYEVDTDKQRIKLTASGNTYDYSIVGNDSRQALLLHSYFGSVINSDPRAYVSNGSRVTQLGYYPAERMNVYLRAISMFALEDATAVDFATHIKAQFD